MITKSWYSIVEYRLNFGSMDKLAELVLYLYNNYNIKKDISESDLLLYLEKIKSEEEFKNKYIPFLKYVPYRLISPFYTELKGVKDHKKNKLIEELSMKDVRALYRIDGKKIILNDNWFDYIQTNQIIIDGWLDHKIICFLQDRNPNVPAIPLKLSAPKKRSLSKVKKYWQQIIRINPLKDIYTEKVIDHNVSFSIDHFIPWSFVLHDKLWNLVPTFKDVNSSKSDKLPDLEQFLTKFCSIQYQAFKMALNRKDSKKILEDYLDINKDIRISEKISKRAFFSAIEETIVPLYQIASNQGFMKWQ